MIHYYTAEDLERLREGLHGIWLEALSIHFDGLIEEGWQLAPFDPSQLLSATPTLGLHAGYRLVAYLYRDGRHGNGVVWAIPAEDEALEPQECPQTDLPRHSWTLDHAPDLDPPRPPNALYDWMDALTGDGSADAYLSASLLARELAELGATGHGAYWDDFTILDEAPSGPTWDWLSAAPQDWRPQVQFQPDFISVAFYTVNHMGTRRITRHHDRYASGGTLRFDSDEQVIAVAGPGGRA